MVAQKGVRGDRPVAGIKAAGGRRHVHQEVRGPRRLRQLREGHRQPVQQAGREGPLEQAALPRARREDRQSKCFEW